MRIEERSETYSLYVVEHRRFKLLARTFWLNLEPVCDAAFCEIVGTDLNFDVIAGHNTNSELS